MNAKDAREVDREPGTSLEPDVVILVQCTAEKREGEHPARDLYDESTYFRKQRTYAETADQWFIQPAKYGLVHPDDVIESYDKHARDLDDLDAWGRQIAVSLDAKVDADATIKLLGGRSYTEPLVPFLEKFGYEVHTPLAGQRIGERMASLDSMASRTLEGFA